MANPTHCHRHRPQRPGRSALRYLRGGPALAAAGPGAGGEPRASDGPARSRLGRRGVHDDSQVRPEAHGAISERANVVVMADEAHRSQYGFVDGGARWMREALPNATFVGFTGTPLERDDRSTRACLRRVRRRLRHPPGGRGRRDRADLLRVADRQAARWTRRRARRPSDEVRGGAKADDDGEEPDGAIRVPLEALVGAPERIGAGGERSSSSTGRSAARRWKARRWS